jgi:transcriptional regulator with XRE-family HTH domain
MNTNNKAKTPSHAARLAAGLTAFDLARAAGTTENRLFQIERGRFRPRPNEAAGIALALMATVEELFPAGTQGGQP